MGKLAGIARRDKKRAPMQIMDSAEIDTATGVAKDSRGRPGPRQVTILSATAWAAACADLGAQPTWTTRRANLLVDDLDLADTAGSILRIGTVELLITGETAPCSRMDEQFPGLTAALQQQWRGGVTCKVLHGGSVALGDQVTLHPAIS